MKQNRFCPIYYNPLSQIVKQKVFLFRTKNDRHRVSGVCEENLLHSYVKFFGEAIKDCCVCVMCVCSMCDNSNAVYAIISQLTPISSKGTRMLSHPIVRECIMRIRIEFVSSHMFETTPMEPQSRENISPICMLCLFILRSSIVRP